MNRFIDAHRQNAQASAYLPISARKMQLLLPVDEVVEQNGDPVDDVVRLNGKSHEPAETTTAAGSN
jgi:hypothetical protein